MLQNGVSHRCACVILSTKGGYRTILGECQPPCKVSRDMGYRSDSIAVSRDMRPLSRKIATAQRGKDIFRGEKWEIDFYPVRVLGRVVDLPIRMPNPNPALDKNLASMGPGILSSIGVGVWRKAPETFPDSLSAENSLINLVRRCLAN